MGRYISVRDALCIVFIENMRDMVRLVCYYTRVQAV